MNREAIKVLIIGIVDALPLKIQKIAYKVIIETRYLLFKIKCKIVARNKSIADPANIYWLSTNRIVKCLSPEDRKVFFNSEKMRGKIVGGNWDISNYEFAETIDVYEALKKRVRERAEWRDTEYYKRILRQVKAGTFLYGIRNETDLDQRCKYLDSLIENIKKEGYHLNRNIYHKNITFEEIDVNIGRSGEYIFRDGIHRLSIAKVLGLKCVPVMVFVRHKEWQEFRDFLFSYAKRLIGGKLYQPTIHPDLADIPCITENYEAEDFWSAIKFHLKKNNGVMLDIGAKIGFWCHKFEDLGYSCYGVEEDPELRYVMQRIKIAENKKFQIIDRSIFQSDFIKKTEFEVVLAINILHHFLETKTKYLQLVNFLKNLKTHELFFEPHILKEYQNKDAYKNYNEIEFVNFLLEHTSLTKSELIYTAKNGSHIFKLF